jgi:hypothetical protein
LTENKNLYLPLSSETVTSILKEYPAITDRLRAQSGPELSALYILHKLPELQAKRFSTLEIKRHLAKLIVVSKEEYDEQNEFSSAVERLINPYTFRTSFALMHDTNLGLLSKDEVKAHHYNPPDETNGPIRW